MMWLGLLAALSGVFSQAAASLMKCSCEPGSVGAPGLMGPYGAKGDHGYPGSSGLTGFPGPKGDVGNKGEQGLKGIAGILTGIPGTFIPGATGSTGAAGATGPPGPPGPCYCPWFGGPFGRQTQNENGNRGTSNVLVTGNGGSLLTLSNHIANPPNIIPSSSSNHAWPPYNADNIFVSPTGWNPQANNGPTPPPVHIGGNTAANHNPWANFNTDNLIVMPPNWNPSTSTELHPQSYVIGTHAASPGTSDYEAWRREVFLGEAKQSQSAAVSLNTGEELQSDGVEPKDSVEEFQEALEELRQKYAKMKEGIDNFEQKKIAIIL